MYNFPVWGTQGGGLVREVGGKHFFVEAPPEFPELGVGDEMPEGWDTIPANDLAGAHFPDGLVGDFSPLGGF